MPKGNSIPTLELFSKKLKTVVSNEELFANQGLDYPFSDLVLLKKALKGDLFLREKSWLLVNKTEAKVLWGDRDTSLTTDDLVEHREDLVVRFRPSRKDGHTWESIEKLEGLEWLRAIVGRLQFPQGNNDFGDKVDI
jgi:hypothetical protein